MSKLAELQNKILAKFGIDKVLHFLAGWAVTASVYMAYPIDLVLILLIGTLLGLVKELFDKYYRKSVFDWRDMLATSVGSIATILVVLLRMLLYNLHTLTVA